MKFTKVVPRHFKGDKYNKPHSDYIGEGVTTKPCKVSTGYYQRGCFPKTTTLPAGTKVKFRLEEFNHWQGSNKGEVYSTLSITADWKFDTETLTVKTHVNFEMDLKDAAVKLGLEKVYD